MLPSFFDQIDLPTEPVIFIRVTVGKTEFERRGDPGKKIDLELIIGVFGGAEKAVMGLEMAFPEGRGGRKDQLGSLVFDLIGER